MCYLHLLSTQRLDDIQEISRQRGFTGPLMGYTVKEQSMLLHKGGKPYADRNLLPDYFLPQKESKIICHQCLDNTDQATVSDVQRTFRLELEKPFPG